jgi:LacI family transcriptional regulator
VAVTIGDVARKAGVSIATVSRVLSPGPDQHPVSAGTAERVRQAALELRFVPSAIARGLVARRSGLLGLLVPDLTDPYYPHIASGVEEAARQAQLAVLICNTLGDPAHLSEYLDLLRARRVDGVLLSGGSSLGLEELQLVVRSGLPVVLIGRPGYDVDLPYVSVDNVSAARAATAHLIGPGRARILHVAGPATQTTMVDRRDGYLQAMGAADLAPVVLMTSGVAEDAYTAIAAELRREHADAIFAATDRLAVAALAALYDLHKAVPDEVAVLGFDDMPLAALLRPALASVAQPAEALGRAAVDVVLGMSAAPLVLDAKLVIRESAKKVSRGPGRRRAPTGSARPAARARRPPWPT